MCILLPTYVIPNFFQMFFSFFYYLNTNDEAYFSCYNDIFFSVSTYIPYYFFLALKIHFPPPPVKL